MKYFMKRYILLDNIETLNLSGVYETYIKKI